MLRALDDFICMLRYGRGVRLTWNKSPGWSGGHVETLLRRYGIRVYQRQYAYREGDEYGAHVPAAQGRWAEYVLRKAGCPLTSPLIDESNRHVRAGGAMPRAWGVPAKPVGFGGRIIDFLMRF